MPMSSVHVGSRSARALLLAVLLVFLAAGAIVGAAALDDDSRDDAPGTTVATSTTSGESSDPPVTPSTDTDPTITGSTTEPRRDDGRFDVDPLEPDNPLAPGTPPTSEPPTCVTEPGKACPHDGTDAADQ